MKTHNRNSIVAALAVGGTLVRMDPMSVACYVHGPQFDSYYGPLSVWDQPLLYGLPFFGNVGV